MGPARSEASKWHSGRGTRRGSGENGYLRDAGQIPSGGRGRVASTFDGRVRVDLSGRMLVAFGVKPDKSKAIELRGGDFFFLKGGQHHQVWAVDETLLDFSAEGPFDVHYD